jgi:hypothetical protein
MGSEAQVTETMVVNIRLGVVAGSSGPGSSGRLIAFCMVGRKSRWEFCGGSPSKGDEIWTS